MLKLLMDFSFISSSEESGFMRADVMQSFCATPLGKRIAELYLDPLTAQHIIESLEVFNEHSTEALIHMFCSTIEMQPSLRVKTKEMEWISTEVISMEKFLVSIPESYDYEYDDFLDSLKTALCLTDWIEEHNEQHILDKFDVRPGELHSKLERIKFLLYGAKELMRLKKKRNIYGILSKLETRLKYGVKEELIPLLQFKGIGRIRARALYRNGLRDVGEIKKVDVSSLTSIVGKQLALSLKGQVGQNIDPRNVKVKENKRRGQISLKDY